MAGRLTNRGEKTRDQIETAMFVLFHAERDIDEVILRNQQAIRRSGLVADVLTPAIERLVQIRRQVRKAKASMTEVWAAGQAKRWEGK